MVAQRERKEARRAAQAVTNLVGDGCVVRLLDEEGGSLRAVAVDHRDSGRRAALERLVRDEHRLELPGGWAGQALELNLAFRVEHGSPEAAAGALGHSAGGHDVHGAVVAPLRRGDEPVGVLVAFRDSFDHPYTLREQRLVEELAQDPGSVTALAGGVDLGAPDPAAIGTGRVLDQVPVGVLVSGPDGVAAYANEPLSALLGVPCSAIVGQPIARFLDEEPQMVRARLAEQTEQQDHRLQRPDGSTVWVRVASTPLVDSRGRRQGTVSTLTEIGERKRLEVDLRLRAAGHEAVAELAERALADEPPQQLMDAAVQTVADILGVEFAALGEVSADGEHLVGRAVVGWDRALVGHKVPLPEHSAGRLALEAEEPVVIGDYLELDRVEAGAIPAELGVRSCVCVGVAGGQGVLSAHSREPGAFSGQDLSFLVSLARVLATRWQFEPPRLMAVTTA